MTENYRKSKTLLRKQGIHREANKEKVQLQTQRDKTEVSNKFEKQIPNLQHSKPQNPEPQIASSSRGGTNPDGIKTLKNPKPVERRIYNTWCGLISCLPITLSKHLYTKTFEGRKEGRKKCKVQQGEKQQWSRQDKSSWALKIESSRLKTTENKSQSKKPWRRESHEVVMATNTIQTPNTQKCNNKVLREKGKTNAESSCGLRNYLQ